MLYSIAKYVMWAVMRLLYAIKVTGAENIPASDGFILCGNHYHSLDPVVLGISTKRRLYPMAKKELFENPLVGAFLRGLGAFPVDRRATDMRAYRHALELLRQGKCLLVFSQGTRTADFSQTKNGAALFALKENVPIVPVGITGHYHFFSPIRVHFGRPVSMVLYSGLKLKTELVEEVMETVMAAVIACCEEAKV